MTGSVISLNTKRAIETQEARAHRASALAARFADATAEDILRAAIQEEFPGRIAMVSSFGTESAVLLQIVAKIKPDIPVIFLDTGKHFAQTLSYRKTLSARLGITNVLDIAPAPTDIETHDPTGTLWRHDTDKCCQIRKMLPLEHALQSVDAWITGRKQFQGGARTRLPVFELNDTHFKVNPIVRWSRTHIDQYAATHDLPSHPLVAQGYPSVGCWPCTHPVAEGGNNRDGRWRGQAKTECGIHNR